MQWRLPSNNASLTYCIPFIHGPFCPWLFKPKPAPNYRVLFMKKGPISPMQRSIRLSTKRSILSDSPIVHNSTSYIYKNNIKAWATSLNDLQPKEESPRVYENRIRKMCLCLAFHPNPTFALCGQRKMKRYADKDSGKCTEIPFFKRKKRSKMAFWMGEEKDWRLYGRGMGHTK